MRFEVSIQALNPDLEVIAPVREWSWSREEEIEYALLIKICGVEVTSVVS
ncbi:MAG: argG [Bacillales bacterium]|nr:argG [Bacillales bacterium]